MQGLFLIVQRVYLTKIGYCAWSDSPELPNKKKTDLFTVALYRGVIHLLFLRGTGGVCVCVCVCVCGRGGGGIA